MKRLLLLMMFVGLGLMGKAQDEGMQKKKMMMMQKPDYEKLKTDLNLTDKQVADWKKLEESMQPEMDKMRKAHQEQMNSIQAKHKAEMDKMHKMRDDKLKTILTKEQFEKHQKSKSQMMNKKMGMQHKNDD
jgi:hypothetical protein